MYLCPKEPNPGEKISASWMRELVRYVRSLTPISGHGVKTSTGPNGTVFSATGSVARKGSVLPGCFDIRPEKTEDEDDPGGFDNCYFLFGSKIYECDETVTDCGELAKGRITALVVDLTEAEPVASISSYVSFSLYQQATLDDTKAFFPLYKTDDDGNVVCDMRNIPTFVGREFES